MPPAAPLPISRRRFVGGLAGTSALALGGCGPAQRRGPTVRGSIRVATQLSSTSDTLDPAKGATSTDYTRHFMLYSGLTAIEDESLAAIPSLAQAIESTDRRNWHFDLRRGVRFHDGSELTSSDVVHSLLRHQDPAIGSKVAKIAEQFAEVRADGKFGVRVVLTGANADLPTILAQSHFLIVRAGQDAPDGTGTGPFRLAEFQPGVRTVGLRNPEYWIEGRPRLERIEVIGISDEVARVNALLSGDVQVINAISPHSIPRVEAETGCAIMASPSSLYSDLIMRQDRLPTGNPHFVMAVKHLIDRPLINRAIYRNRSTLANDHPIAPFQKYFNAEIPQRTYDLDLARWHVRKGGLEGMRLPIYATPAANSSVDVASILQEYGSRAGLNFAVNRVPADGYWSNHWMRHPMTFGDTNPRPTADLIFSLFFDSGAEWNESAWKNERFDKLLVEARGATDDGLRGEMYGEMQQLVHDKCGVAIPVFISLIDGYDTRVKGMRPLPLGGFMGYRFAEHVWWED
jgi:peptide/nickel transport system substrate-binding protein